MQIYFLPPPLWPPGTLFASRFPLLPSSMPGQSRVGGGGRGAATCRWPWAKYYCWGKPAEHRSVFLENLWVSGSNTKPAGDCRMLPAGFWGDLRGGNDGMRSLSFCLGGDQRRERASVSRFKLTDIPHELTRVQNLHDQAGAGAACWLKCFFPFLPLFRPW